MFIRGYPSQAFLYEYDNSLRGNPDCARLVFGPAGRMSFRPDSGTSLALYVVVDGLCYKKIIEEAVAMGIFYRYVSLFFAQMVDVA